ncbi:MAG TPA: hypothetical protein VFH76_30560 [Kribbella sp.]|nr:hypothetical protein [Kribbella sp.]
MIEERRRTVAVALVAVALGLLFAGRFVTFEDGGLDWLFPLGLLAVLPAVASLIVAWPDPRARLWLGIVLAALMLLIGWQGAVNDEFRFVWGSWEGEFWFFEVFLFLLSSVLLTTAGVALGGRRWLLRIPAYLIGMFVLAIAVAAITATYYGSTCTGDEEEGCLAALGGLVWGAAAFVASPVLIVVIELLLWWRRRHKAGLTRRG